MAKDEGRAHVVLVPASLGKEPMFYTIELIFAPDHKSYAFRCRRHIRDRPALAPRIPRIGIAGSGERYLLARRKEWVRSLLCVVRACDIGRMTPHAVADYLARLNNEVHLGVSDNSVGPRCIVT